MGFNRFLCYLKAIPFWVKMGFKKDFFIPHVFIDEEWIAPIFLNHKTNKVRIADSYAHEMDEEWIPNAIFIGRTCKYCGYKSFQISSLTGLSCPRHPNGANKGRHSPAL